MGPTSRAVGYSEMAVYDIEAMMDHDGHSERATFIKSSAVNGPSPVCISCSTSVSSGPATAAIGTGKARARPTRRWPRPAAGEGVPAIALWRCQASQSAWAEGHQARRAIKV